MRTLAIAGGGLLVLLVLFVVVVGRTLGGGRDVDCSTVQLPPAGRWATLPTDEQHTLAGDLELCGRLKGRTPAEVAASLGPPSATGRNGDGSQLVVYELPNGTTSSGVSNPPDRLMLNLGPDGRIASTRIDLAATGSGSGGPIR